MQPRFERRNGNAPYSLVDQPRFRAGFDFLRLRADAGEMPVELAEWWEDFSLGTDAEREALIEAVRETSRPKRGSGGQRRTPAASAAAPVAEGDAEPTEEASGEGGDAPRKRRRRRRKPSGNRGGADAGGAPLPVPSPGHDVD
jgi:poly(A) polymerase